MTKDGRLRQVCWEKIAQDPLPGPGEEEDQNTKVLMQQKRGFLLGTAGLSASQLGITLRCICLLALLFLT